jgi:superfamily II DNA or RNA helicase
MSGLADLQLKPEYRKGRDDIAGCFYSPCMRAATAFDRAVGFFSSTIYVLAWDALKAFVHNNGKMRIVCSPVLSPQDIEALEAGYASKAEESIRDRLIREVEGLLEEQNTKRPALVLASLVALGVIDFRIAIMKPGSTFRDRIFHDKLGLFSDGFGNILAFKGSMNETWAGLSSDGNLESVDVYVNWADDRDRERVGTNLKDFEDLWSNEFPTVTVQPFPDIAKSALISAARVDEWESVLDEIVDDIERSKALSADKDAGGRTPRPHQILALENWNAVGRRGVFEHATGSGKTFTALCAIRTSLEQDESVLILVPSDLLLQQWASEINSTLVDLAPAVLLAGGGHTSWRDGTTLSAFTRSRRARPRVVISTMQTASTEDFLNRVSNGNHLLLVADEVHRMGSPNNQNIFKIESGPRLGLSATPRRAGDAAGTDAIFNYFGNVVPPVFSLTDAVASGALTPYFYYVHTVQLSPDEQSQWNQLTSQIRPLQARAATQVDIGLTDRLKQLLIKRARITKGASGKIPLAVSVITKNYKSGERWIVYCEAQEQLQAVKDALKSAGIEALEYHSAMQGDRERTLSHFTKNGGVLVSIKCLDEGVDIPAVSHALILASSKNPREFVQRRGRVLRRFPGKQIAFVHDAIVVPAAPEDEEEPNAAILMGEIARAIEFGSGALNPSSIHDLELIALRANLDCSAVLAAGYEDDDA